MTLNQLFWKLMKEKFTLHEVNFGGAAKISTVFYQNATYHSMNPDAMLMLRMRQSIDLVLTNVLSASFLIIHITFDEISLQLKVRFW